MTRSIVIAEDDEDIQQLLTFKLQANGFDVTTFEDGRACIDHLQETDELPDLVVLDVMMPRMDGFQVLERIRDEDTLADLPVLMLTARSREDDVVEGFERGATDYVTKPFSPNEVVARIKRMLPST
ncbi:response regulator receiver protein [Natronococcus amylolyticus DSM 10524]|uniref:Response regulator receiver protein n=1 Tax=Natronococcus amylolyticus DSM 10524 TaxID=1227497 RepID=L9X458_9EURY|nr:response regulator [Natronococcus amylolyticus]ELY56539.1 response regulator receiver protein [Natronococcus amylolyticus DSM 10524]